MFQREGLNMSRLDWGVNPHNYESGVDRGVFYPQSGPGQAWSGLLSIAENSTDSSRRALHMDGVKSLHRHRPGYFSGTIEVVNAPEGFHDILVQRRPKPFGFSYRTLSGDSYKIHLVYNVLVEPSSHRRELGRLDIYRWRFTTLPEFVPGVANTAHLIVETSVAYAWTVSELEDILYGTDEEPPRLPPPHEVFDVFERNSILIVTDHGDGTFTVEGPEEAIVMLDPDTFEITWPSAVYISEDTYRIKSL